MATVNKYVKDLRKAVEISEDAVSTYGDKYWYIRNGSVVRNEKALERLSNIPSINCNSPNIFDISESYGLSRIDAIRLLIRDGYDYCDQKKIWYSAKNTQPIDSLISDLEEDLQEITNIGQWCEELTLNPESKGYIVTSVVSNSIVDFKALKVLKNMSEQLGYDLVIARVKWGTSDDYESSDHLTICDDSHFLSVGSLKVWLNTSLNINANAANPLSGLAGIAGNSHMIVPHPVRYLETTASPRSTDCRVLLTTGTISNLSRTSVGSRVGSVTQFHSCTGAVVVQDSDYPVTPVNIDTVNYTVDFEGTTYTADSSFKSEKSAYVYLPDMHLAHPRVDYHKSLFRECELYSVQIAIGGDMFDGSSLLHHERDRIGFFANRMDLFQELKGLEHFAKCLGSIVDSVKLIVGNHETFADRFWSGDLKSLLDGFSKDEQVFLLKGMAYVVQNSEHTPKGIKYKGLMEYFLENTGAGEYLSIAKSGLIFKDIALGFHGHEFLVNRAGARSSNYKVCAGHTHAPSIWRNYYNSGYGGVLDPSYQNGMSKAAPAHIFINKDGKRQMRLYLPKSA